MSDISVSRMVLEELRLVLKGGIHRQASVDILLTPVNHADEAQFEWIHPPCEYIQRVGASIHQVQLCEYSDGSSTLWINGAS